MIEIKDKHDCVGCRACEQICPKQCISMLVDNEGFRYPVVDLTLCIDCHLCEKICPVLIDRKSSKPLKCLACKSSDTNVQLASSSGGVFSVLAAEIIQRGGVVFGALFDDKFKVIHSSTDSLDGIAPFRRSKYVQSDTCDAFSKVKSLLTAGREVLFCGTPCQVKGLKLFLRKEYENLWTVDFICHGVPSPKVWEDYLANLIEEQGAEWKLTDVNFRSKSLGGWHKFALQFDFEDSDGKSNVIARYPGQDPYYQLFFQNISLRPSCYKCPAKGFSSGSDFTLGDFWGIQKFLPEFDDNKGVSLLMANTQKTIQLLGQLNIKSVEVDYDIAIRSNPSANHSVAEPKQRKAFFADDNFTMNRLKKFSGLDFYGRVRRRIIGLGLSILKR